MGQSLSGESDTEGLPEEVFRQARLVSELAVLSYEEFLDQLKQLNDLSQKCMGADGKQLVFAIKEGSDSSILWKGTVRISCDKVDPITNHVESYRLLSLNQFLKVYKSITNRCAAAQTSQADDPSSSMTSNLKQMTTPVVLRHVTQQMVPQQDLASECCICLERQPDMLLPCAHVYCRLCIEQWSENNKTCPICREEATKDEAWVMTEAPNTLEVSEDICASLMELVDRQRNVDSDDST